jgi:hypothetical protein
VRQRVATEKADGKNPRTRFLTLPGPSPIEGEAYFDRAFRDERYRLLKELGTEGLTKRAQFTVNEQTGKRQVVYIVEWQEEEEPKKVTLN